jgi:hypothetical protein
VFIFAYNIKEKDMKTLKEIDKLNCAIMNVNYNEFLNFTISEKFAFNTLCYQIVVLTNKAFKMIPQSPKQKATLNKINKLKLTYSK